MIQELEWVTTCEIPITTYWVKIRKSTLRKLGWEMVRNAVETHYFNHHCIIPDLGSSGCTCEGSPEEIKHISHYGWQDNGFVVLTSSHPHCSFATVLLDGEQESNRVGIVALPKVCLVEPPSRLSRVYFRLIDEALTLSAVNKK